jgi:phosphoribosylglycinamide formyltransferase 1
VEAFKKENAMAADALVSCELPEAEKSQPHRIEPIGVLASGNGSNFEAIAEAIERGELTAEIRCVVYNNPNAGVARRAMHHGVPAMLIDHRDHTSRESFDVAVSDALQEAGAEWIIMAGWMRIATSVLLDRFRDRVLNIHPSLLPSFRGLRAVEQAIEAGVRITGCTVHLVSPAVDNGPIIGQAAIAIYESDTAESVHSRIHEAEHKLYPLSIQRAFAQG